jgi:hypothetical protein
MEREDDHESENNNPYNKDESGLSLVKLDLSIEELKKLEEQWGINYFNDPTQDNLKEVWIKVEVSPGEMEDKRIAYELETHIITMQEMHRAMDKEGYIDPYEFIDNEDNEDSNDFTDEERVMKALEDGEGEYLGLDGG